MRPLAASRPAGFSTAPTELALMSTICTGCQPSSAIFLIAWAACFGVVALKNRSAPLSLILRICESMVGSVSS